MAGLFGSTETGEEREIQARGRKNLKTWGDVTMEM